MEHRTCGIVGALWVVDAMLFSFGHQTREKDRLWVFQSLGSEGFFGPSVAEGRDLTDDGPAPLELLKDNCTKRSAFPKRLALYR
ncbi:hypothetical protein E5288_WYG004113 [Bos mutus]|uniref:Uncharacterized protein n=1 Tax=Bos mutus TaxID=72004 RepID=A0A6B0R830_9CETA|nr:hypothetical protein [Bos mutus]